MVLEAVGLTKDFGSVRAVENVTFSIGAGEVVGFLGPNGAGKSTTMRMLLGLIRPSAGKAVILGEVVRPGADCLRRVGATVDRPAVYPHLSARANVLAFTSAAGISDGRVKADRALEAVGLDPSLSTAAGRFSTGMRQRLATALALVREPAVVILDEPSDGLDPLGAAHLRELLVSVASSGAAVLLSSHRLTEVERVCSRVAMIVSGRLVAQGSLAELLGPATELRLSFADGHACAAAAAILDSVGAAPRTESLGMTLTSSLDRVTSAEQLAFLAGAGLSPTGIEQRARSLEELFIDLARPADVRVGSGR